MPKGTWASKEELQNYFQGLGMKHTIFVQPFSGRDSMTFTAGMRDLILYVSSPPIYGIWVSIIGQLPQASSTTDNRSRGDTKIMAENRSFLS